MSDTRNEHKPPTDPKRVKAFATFFKNYMSIWSVIVASLPIPVTAAGAIPVFKAHKWVLTTYTPLFCFLALGFIFYSRHSLARPMFPRHFSKTGVPDRTGAMRRLRTFGPDFWNRFVACLPLTLILFSAFFVYEYHLLLKDSVDQIQKAIPSVSKFIPYPDKYVSLRTDTNRVDIVPDTDTVLATYPDLPAASICLIGAAISNNPKTSMPYAAVRAKIADQDFVLEHTPEYAISNSALLMICYVGIFLCAEAAFILMAIKEYLQDLLGLHDTELIVGKKISSISSPPAS